MALKKRTIEFMLKPPLWLCIVIWTVGVLSLSGTLTLYFLGLGAEAWAWSVHAVSAVFMILSVYAVLTVIGIPERAKDKPGVQKFFSSYSTRAFVYASCSIVFNGCYVAFGIVVAYITHSPWLGVLVGYHVFLLLPRIFVVVPKWRNRKRDVDEKRQQLRSYSYCGLALVLLSLAFLPVIRMTIQGQNNYHYIVGVITYVSAIALYTFIKLGIAIYNLKKVRGNADLSLRAVKNISFADALISLFALQAMMLKELEPQPDTALLNAKLNPAIGVIISIIICAMGLYMLISGVKKLKAYNRELAELTVDEYVVDKNIASARNDEQNADSTNCDPTDNSQTDG